MAEEYGEVPKKMVMSMMENTEMIKNVVMVNIYGQAEMFSKEISKMICATDMVRCIGLTVESIKVHRNNRYILEDLKIYYLN